MVRGGRVSDGEERRKDSHSSAVGSVYGREEVLWLLLELALVQGRAGRMNGRIVAGLVLGKGQRAVKKKWS
jgi:hypothetical protein